MILLVPYAEPMQAVGALRNQLLRHQIRLAVAYLRGGKDPDLLRQWGGREVSLATYGLYMAYGLYIRKESAPAYAELRELRAGLWKRGRRLMEYPGWWNVEAVHASHRRWLIWKNPAYADVFTADLPDVTSLDEPELAWHA